MNGIRLKKRRKELGLSGEKIAQELDTTRVTVSRWETGTSEPDDKTKLELARLLNTTVSYLIGETDNPEKADNSEKSDMKTQSPDIFTERVSLLMKRNFLSKKDMAKRLGMEYLTFWRKLKGERDIDVILLMKIAQVLGTTVSYLVGETDNPEKFVTAKTDTSFHMKGSENMVGEPVPFGNRKAVSSEIRKIQNKLFDITNSIADLYKDANRVIREELYANEVESQKLDDIQRTCVDLLKVLHPSF